MAHLLNAIDELLVTWLKERRQGAYSVGQVRRWLFARRASDFREMTDLPPPFRSSLLPSLQEVSNMRVLVLGPGSGTFHVLL